VELADSNDGISFFWTTYLKKYDPRFGDKYLYENGTA
jgi:hypothetical protein